MGSIDWGDVLRGALAFFLVVVGLGIAYVCVRLGSLLARMAGTVGAMTDEVVPILNRAQTTVDGINLELVRVDDIMVTAVNATKGAEKTVSTLSAAATAPVRKATGLAAAAKEAFATFRTRRTAGPNEAEAAAALLDAAPPPAAPTAPPAADIPAAATFRDAALAGAERFQQAMAPAVAAAKARPVPTVPPPTPADVFERHVAASGAAAPAAIGGHSAVPDAPNEPVASASADPPAVTPAGVDVPDTLRERRRGPSISQISWALPKRGAR